MKTVCIVQARTGSTRLPGKVLLPVAGKTLLERMLQRVLAASTITEIVVATTRAPEDEPIREVCNRIGIACYSGHPTDLLDRHYKIGLNYRADVLVKIPSDCPLIDPRIIDNVIGYYQSNLEHFDFVSNLHPASFPDGNDVEVMPVDILAAAWIEASRQFEREHTTPFLWDQPDRFRIGNYKWESGFDYSMSHKWTIDYPEDYLFVTSIYNELYSDTHMFNIQDILDLLSSRPDIFQLNSKYARVNLCRDHTNALQTITSTQTRMPSL